MIRIIYSNLFENSAEVRCLRIRHHSDIFALICCANKYCESRNEMK